MSHATIWGATVKFEPLEPCKVDWCQARVDTEHWGGYCQSHFKELTFEERKRIIRDRQTGERKTT
jgi:hypothetical protein